MGYPLSPYPLFSPPASPFLILSITKNMKLNLIPVLIIIKKGCNIKRGYLDANPSDFFPQRNSDQRLGGVPSAALKLNWTITYSPCLSVVSPPPPL